MSKLVAPVEPEAAEAAVASPAASGEASPKRRSLERQNSGTSVMQSHAAKIRNAARMAGGGIHWAESTGRRHSSNHGHGSDARRPRKTTTLAARYQDEISRREVSTVWSLGKPFDALKKLLAAEFGHPEVGLVDAETGNGINSDPELVQPSPSPPAPPHCRPGPLGPRSHPGQPPPR